MKKVIIFIMTLAMTLSLMIGSAASADEGQYRNWPEETLKIGVVNMDTTNTAYAYSLSYCEYIESNFNIQFIQSESISTVEDEMNFIESCAAAGCKGIIGWRNVGGASIIKLCENMGMYYYMASAGESVISKYGSNDYFIGYLDAGAEVDYAKGYTWAKTLVENGCRKIVYMSGGADYGVDIFVNRRNGFYDAIEEANQNGAEVEVIAEINTWPDSDSYAAMQDAAIAQKMDGIGDSVGVDYWIQPLFSAGMLDGSVKMATNIDITEDVAELFSLGTISVGTYDDKVLCYIAPATIMIVNAVNGHMELTRADGAATAVPTPMWYVETEDEINVLVDFTSNGGAFISADEMASFFPEFNEEASLDSFLEVFRNYTLEKAIEVASK